MKSEAGPSQAASKGGGGDSVMGMTGTGGASKGNASKTGGGEKGKSVAGSAILGTGRTTFSDEEKSGIGSGSKFGVLATATRGAVSKGEAKDVAGSVRKLGGALDDVPIGAPIGATPCTSPKSAERPDSEALPS